MPQIDFYILHHTQTFLERDRFVCRLVDKVWHQGYHIYIHTTPAQAKVLDDLLWTFKQESFLPHDIYSEVSPKMAPIQIGYAEPPNEGLAVLVNLTETVPPFFKQFKRIVEIVMDTPQAREIGRQHYRLYRESGHELRTHDIKG